MKNKKIVSLIALLLVVSAVLAVPAHACGLDGHKDKSADSAE